MRKFPSCARRLSVRLRSSRGATIVETLAAVLISTLAIIGLVTTVVTAARLNHDAHERNQSLQEAAANAATAQGDLGTAAADVTPAGGTHGFKVRVYGDASSSSPTVELYSFDLVPEGPSNSGGD